jgi:hypothetical protein
MRALCARILCHVLIYFRGSRRLTLIKIHLADTFVEFVGYLISSRDFMRMQQLIGKGRFGNVPNHTI